MKANHKKIYFVHDISMYIVGLLLHPIILFSLFLPFAFAHLFNHLNNLSTSVDFPSLLFRIRF